MINYKENTPLYQQIAIKLEELIKNNAFPELKLPTERQLAELFKVSVITIKQSLNILSSKELIYRRPRRGTFISKKDAAEENASTEKIAMVKNVNWLKFLDLNYATAAEIDSSITNRFEVENPEWNLKIKDINKLDQLLDSYEQEIQDADIYTMTISSLNTLISQDTLTPLNILLNDDFRDEYFSSALNPAIVDGNVYALPRNLNTTCLFYNETIFNDASVAIPQDTISWNDLSQSLRKLPKQHNGEELLLFAYCTYAARFWENFIWQNGGEIFDNNGDKCLLGTQSCLEGINGCVDFLHSLDLNKTKNISKEPHSFFSSKDGQNLACFIGSPRFHILLDRFSTDKWVAKPLPSLTDKKVSGANVFFVGLNKHANAPEKAFSAMKLICQEFGQNLLGETLTSLPARISDAETFFNKPKKNMDMRGFLSAAKSEIHLTEPWHYDNFKFYLLQENINNCIQNPKKCNEICRKTASIINNLHTSTT